METWKDIPGYEGLYQVSSTGLIRNKRQKLLKQKTSKKSPYKKISLRVNNTPKSYYVHRLVLSAFKPSINENLLTVDHIDRNPTNNNLSNLRWLTMVQNNKRQKMRRIVKFITNDLIEVHDPKNNTIRRFRYSS